MPLKIHNTLSRETELFEPLNPPKVNMYVCGITPYDSPHLGHARAYITFDVVRRYLEYLRYDVTYIQNITDIDDKIIKEANEEGRPIGEITAKYTDEYFKMMDLLSVKPATRYPKATEHIPEMIKTIEVLIAKGYAYEVSGDVYYEVAKFKDYGKLSHRTESAMTAGARVAIDERKKSPLDFALWKACKPDEPSWESPWGPGRPGWHIECSAMSTKYLGETFDIHGGGLDLVFPHHENEIAQAEASTGKPFAKYWIHNGFVTVNKEKMSKSLKNFFTIREVLAKFNPVVVRLFLLSTHYRSPINYSDEDIMSVADKLVTLQECFDKARKALSSSFAVRDHHDYLNKISEFEQRFARAMDNDFNTPEAIGIIFDLKSFIYELMNKGADKVYLLSARNLMNDLLVVLGLNIKETAVPTAIEEKMLEREEAKGLKDFNRSDDIRKSIEDAGYSIRDTEYGSVASGTSALLTHLDRFRSAGIGKLSISKDDDKRTQ